MEKNFSLTESELDKLTVCIEEIDIIIGQIINHGIPEDYKEYLLEKLTKIGNMNTQVGKILDVWED